jgi:hypothetical protein
MALLGQTLILYAIIGIGVAVAILASRRERFQAEHWFRVLTAPFFWPLYLPILLGSPSPPVEDSSEALPAVPQDGMTAAISQVDTELAGALRSLDGWAEGVLAREKDRLHELRSAWTAQAERIRAMDRLLAATESSGHDRADSGAMPCAASPAVQERWQNSEKVRRQNFERLKQVRERTYLDLMGTLAWVRELVSMIHLAKFTGAPASRAEELVAQIAAAVEGLSALTWQEEAMSELVAPNA